MTIPARRLPRAIPACLIGLLVPLLPLRPRRRSHSHPPWRRPRSVSGEFIRVEMESKQLPGLSIAVADRSGLLWAEESGLASPARKGAATAETIYRVASVSKPFTAIAVMRRVERGELDLDRRSRPTSPTSASATGPGRRYAPPPAVSSFRAPVGTASRRLFRRVAPAA